MSYESVGAVSAGDISKATEQIQKYGPDIAKALGPMAAALLPTIVNAVKSAGPNAAPLINALPIPANVKKFIIDIINPKAVKAPPIPPPVVKSAGIPLWAKVVGGAVVVGVGVSLVKSKKKK